MTQVMERESEVDRRQAEQHNRPSIAELRKMLIKRDGDKCAYCESDFSVRERTIDHIYPQSKGYADGWTYEQVWDLSNLCLACKPCNAKKGNMLLDEDGNIPPKKTRTFRYRRDKRGTRVGMCEVCQNGHYLLADETCASCGGDAQAFPRTHFARYQDCDHEILWCAWCSIGDVPRKSSIAAAMRQSESTELGEPID